MIISDLMCKSCIAGDCPERYAERNQYGVVVLHRGLKCYDDTIMRLTFGEYSTMMRKKLTARELSELPSNWDNLKEGVIIGEVWEISVSTYYHMKRDGYTVQMCEFDDRRTRYYVGCP